MKKIYHQRIKTMRDAFGFSIFSVFFCALCFMLGGCTVAQETTQTSGMGRRLLSMQHIYPGMTRSEVEIVLGKKVVVGYELVTQGSELYKPVTVNNPHHSETVRTGTSTYQVDYYFVGIKKQDGEISDEELMPIVFEYDSLVGKGWDYLKREIKK